MRTPSSPLSIVIPSRNTCALTLACVDAVLRATARQSEIIVVDDASTDRTAAALRDLYPDIVVDVCSENVGFTRAANRGLDQATGDLLLLLNSDTEIDAQTLPSLLRAFATNDRLGIAGAELLYPDGSPQWSAGKAPTTLWLLALASGLPALLGAIPGYRLIKPVGAQSRLVDWVSGAAMAIRRTTWEEIGPFDTSYNFYCQDLDLCVTARRFGWDVRVIRGFRVVHHHAATIGTTPGAAGHHHPALLWSDLLRIKAKHDGERARKRAAAALRIGTRARLAGRLLRGLVLTGQEREEWIRQSEAYRAALRVLDRTGGSEP